MDSHQELSLTEITSDWNWNKGDSHHELSPTEITSNRIDFLGGSVIVVVFMAAAEDEEICPDLEPFFFDEAEAVADHKRRLQRQQEEAHKEEQRVQAVNADRLARANILDYDPKQDGEYYNRFYLADFSTFDLDDLCKRVTDEHQSQIVKHESN